MGRLLPSIARDSAGVTVTEFALTAPVLLLMMMGVFDIGYNIYAKSVLQGAMQKAARDSTIEGVTEGILDQRVTDAVHIIAPSANVGFKRTAYAQYSDIDQPEDFDDIDASGACDNGEPFTDANGNGVWDADRGVAGKGDAREAVLYTATMRYKRAFPLANLMALDDEFETSVSTVLRNQPFSLQPERAMTGNC